MPRDGGFLLEARPTAKLGPTKPGTSPHLSCAPDDISAYFGHGHILNLQYSQRKGSRRVIANAVRTGVLKFSS